jgi:ribosome-associated protein
MRHARRVRGKLADMRDVDVRGDVIRLGQLLKLAGLADSGGEAKALLAEGVVTVNGEAESRRGRQLHDGDVVAVGDADPVRVVAEAQG